LEIVFILLFCFYFFKINFNNSGEAVLALFNIECYIASYSDSVNDDKMTCANYIKIQKQQDLQCERDVIYESLIENVGNKCIFIKRVRKIIDTKGYSVNIQNWSQKKKKFCRGEKLPLKRKVTTVDLCSYANKDIDFQVKVTRRSGGPLVAEGSIQFPGPNSATTLVPTQAPSRIPSQAQRCNSKPNTITFKLKPNTCDDSTHSQAVQTTRRMKRKGKGSIKEPCRKCHKCEDVNDSCDIKSIDEKPFVTITNKNTKEELWRGCIDFLKDFVFKPDPDKTMPDCIEITIHDHDPSSKYDRSKYAGIAQIVSFETVCTPDAPLSIGDMFGAVEIVNFNQSV
jgi:hypothetical protein